MIALSSVSNTADQRHQRAARHHCLQPQRMDCLPGCLTAQSAHDGPTGPACRPAFGDLYFDTSRHISCRLLETPMSACSAASPSILRNPWRRRCRACSSFKPMCCSVIRRLSPLSPRRSDGRLDLQPQRVIAGGETVTPTFREIVKNA